jgi:hypothetical protein
MNGSGCRNCPVKPCETMHYRGSACSAQRAKFGLGDPMTNADRIRSMTDEGLAKWLDSLRYGFGCELCANVAEKCDENCVEHFVEWLQQPAEVE